MRLFRAVFLVLLAGCLASKPATAATKRALLIGINAYTPNDDSAAPTVHDSKPHKPDSRFGSDARWHNLHGPERDVAMMRAELTELGFDKDAIHVLEGQKATRDEILKEIDEYVIKEPQAGDTVLFYFAGHGSLRLNSKSTKSDHMDETIVPADAYSGADDIRDKELARKFNQAINKGVHLVAIFDSCHSGTMARGKSGTRRLLDYDDRDAADGDDYGTPGKPEKVPPQQRGAIIITAALSTQSAEEFSPGGPDEANGVFTKFFTRALTGAGPGWTARDLVRSTASAIRADGWTQVPTIEGDADRPLFGDFTVTKIHATVQRKVDPDQVVLDAGAAFGFAKGTEFTILPAAKAVAGIELQVVNVTGMGASEAKVIVGKWDDIKVGNQFELSKMVVPAEAKLTIFVPGVAGEDQFQKAVAQISGLKAAGKRSFVNDPIVDLPTHLVYWTRSGWMLKSPEGKVGSLGPVLSSETIASHVPENSKVFVSLPLTEALIDGLKKKEGLTSGNVVLSDKLEASQYILIGRTDPDHVDQAEFALALPALFGAINSESIVRSTVIDTDEDGRQTQRRDVTCSTESPMPLRTDWAAQGADRDSLAAASEKLQQAALILGRSRSWLQLQGHNSLKAWPYRLAVMKKDTDRPLGSDFVAESTKYDIDLVANPDKLASIGDASQWVYVFGISCDGRGQLLFPENFAGGEAPIPHNAAGEQLPAKIYLTSQEISPPLGFDTLILLTTPLSEKITNPSVFEYSAVLTEKRGLDNPLDDLIGDINGLSRGNRPVPDSWSIQKLNIKSK